MQHSVQTVPRELGAIRELTRSVRQRLAFQLNLIQNEDQERAFAAAEDQVQAQALLEALQLHDSKSNGAAPAPEGAPMTFPNQPSMPAPTFPNQTGFPAPAMPATGPAMPQQAPQAGFGGLPPMPSLPGMQPQGMPQMGQGPQGFPPANLPGFPPMSSGMANFAAALPGQPIAPQGQAIREAVQQQQQPAQSSSDDIKTLVDAVRGLTDAVKAQAQTQTETVTSILGTIQSQGTDLRIVLSGFLYFSYMFASAQGMSVEQFLQSFSQWSAQLDPAVLNQMRAVTAPKGKG